jgi:predicted nucleic acid-binding protein
LGFPPATARDEVDKIESLLTLLPDTPAVYAIWRSLVVDYSVSGVQVYDARIVATMKTHGIKNLLTFNVDDFKRYTEITVHHPQNLAI